MGNLASGVDELLAVDPRDVPCVTLGEEIVELYRQASRLQAAILDRVEAFDRTGGAKATPHQTTAAWLRAILDAGRSPSDLLLSRSDGDGQRRELPLSAPDP